MKYILMMQFNLSDWRTCRMELWPQEDIDTHMAHLMRMNEEIIASGERIDVQGLATPETAVFVSATADGTPAVSDGPFAEAKEFLAGYMIIDVETPQRAHEIAARWSSGPGPGGTPLNLPVEVRPIMSCNYT